MKKFLMSVLAIMLVMGVTAVPVRQATAIPVLIPIIASITITYGAAITNVCLSNHLCAKFFAVAGFKLTQAVVNEVERLGLNENSTKSYTCTASRGHRNHPNKHVHCY